MKKSDEQNAKMLPNLCYSTLPTSGDLIVIKLNEAGYYPCDYSTPDAEANRRMADELNLKIGISKAQEAAMIHGSMFGWHVPAADPGHYDDNGKPIKHQPESRNTEHLENLTEGRRAIPMDSEPFPPIADTLNMKAVRPRSKEENGGLTNMDAYTEKGFSDRNEYLKSLAKQYKLDLGNVRIWAYAMGPDADFSALPQYCEQQGKKIATSADPYRERGFNNRADYLSTLAAEFEIDLETVEKIASEMEPSDHFDGLLAILGEAHDTMHELYGEAEDNLEDEYDEDLEP